MSHYQDQYEGARSRTDEYGNPVHGAGMTGGAHGAGGYGTTGAADPGYGGMGMETGHHGQGAGHEQLRRSGSSSSSSSEDDGQGGRRKKKGLKEKLAGGKKTEQSHMSSTTPGQVGEGHEKKGIMEKIKEKLPGHHDDQPRS